MPQRPPQLVTRRAVDADLETLFSIRFAVRENRLESRASLPDALVLEALAEGGGLLAEAEGRAVGFTIARPAPPQIWALFVLPDMEGCGIGSALLLRALAWLRAQGAGSAVLTTGPGTRAAGFYQAHGWRETGRTPRGELRLVLDLCRADLAG
ncbi:GNAT family N-acetyltransferase [Geminicoccaceae bacterium 1502E]|nr:GNAT family N-acetyltransferase [Geminicoccaceae bacterium 1502E]